MLGNNIAKCYNPLTTAAISELLEMIGKSSYFLVSARSTALHSGIIQTAGTHDALSMWENRCMHATACLLRAGQPKRDAGVTKSGEFPGEFSWVVYDPMVVRGLFSMTDKALYNPLTTAAISELLEMIGKSSYFLVSARSTALHSGIIQTAGTHDALSMWENRCMHATACLLRAGQPKRDAGVTKSGEFPGEFSWVVYDPMVVRGLFSMTDKALYNPLTTAAISELLEMIGKSSYFLVSARSTALHSGIIQTAGTHDALSMWENRCMHATACLLRAGQPKRDAGVTKSGEFPGEFSWVVYDPMVVRGLK